MTGKAKTIPSSRPEGCRHEPAAPSALHLGQFHTFNGNLAQHTPARGGDPDCTHFSAIMNNGPSTADP